MDKAKTGKNVAKRKFCERCRVSTTTTLTNHPQAGIKKTMFALDVSFPLHDVLSNDRIMSEPLR
jgi:hypothetical protein